MERSPSNLPGGGSRPSTPGPRHLETLLFRGDSCLQTDRQTDSHTHTTHTMETFALTSWNCLTFACLTPLRLCRRHHLRMLFSLSRVGFRGQNHGGSVFVDPRILVCITQAQGGVTEWWEGSCPSTVHILEQGISAGSLMVVGHLTA